VFKEETGKQKILHGMTASIPKIYYVLNFFMYVILICYCHSQTIELHHIFKGFISMPSPSYCGSVQVSTRQLNADF